MSVREVSVSLRGLMGALLRRPGLTVGAVGELVSLRARGMRPPGSAEPPEANGSQLP